MGHPEVNSVPSAEPGLQGESWAFGGFRLQRWTDPGLPGGLSRLLAEAEGQGYAWIVEFLGEWTGRPFANDGEALFLAFDEADPVAMAVISADPHVSDRETGRLRYIYVGQGARKQGLARCLVEACLRRGGAHWQRLRLHADNPVAARLYESYGFRPVDGEARSTHVRIAAR
ncbi:GNAT family N-acetyltransferase [Lichenifustis flavocetrariae]|uniref:GNAT family N-acetyltransferase n=1 Tax=Lichenifustis flavocetrariae TaxID=2949735 RepID=A0AA41YTP6_9HYPH|nr:GNAT family N-acetyltransferase [Lichenifustis flavocetrariae]MCW6506832.1 GNAT family N-acetyltransferase [Lichenifustis flavocetrariae]